MSRRFIRPFFSFWDPFFREPILSKRAIPGGSKANRMYNQEYHVRDDPYKTFDNFFKDQYSNPEKLSKEEKEFFEKHYPERVVKKFNPYEVLGIDEKAGIEKIKEAYRTNAIKYHPKNDSSEEAQKKFTDLSRAYNELINKRQTNDYGQDVSSKSLFEDFYTKVENSRKREAPENREVKRGEEKLGREEWARTKCQKKDQFQSSHQRSAPVNQRQKSEFSQRDFLKGAELYSQSSYIEYKDGKKKTHVQRVYQKEGRTLKVNRTKETRPDGKVEISETFDDGKQVKNLKSIQQPQPYYNYRRLVIDQ